MSRVNTRTNVQNCSTYNPCGNRGYCTDNATLVGDTWQCECKYWWEGKICDIQSAKGKEVIAMGVIAGIVILTYYILDIIWLVRKRRKEPKVIKDKTETDSSIEVIIKSMSDKKNIVFQFLPLLVPLFTMIIAAVALIIQWVLLQPIHNDIVDKFKRQMPVYYVPNSFCIYISDKNLNIVTFSISCVLILIFVIMTKRVSFKRDLCHGYIGPVIPVNFFLHAKRRFASAVFAIMSSQLLEILWDAFQQETTGGNGSIIQYLKNVAFVFVVCVCYYPILAGVYMDTFFTLTCAMVYTWLFYIITVIHQGYCPESYYPTESDYRANASSKIKLYLSYYGTGPSLIAVQLCTDIPRYLCLAYISVRLPIMLINKIRQYFRQNEDSEKKLTQEERAFFLVAEPYSVERLYVKNLFRSTNVNQSSRPFIARIIPKFIYEWRDDFRFSLRILCIYSALALVLYVMTIKLVVQQLPNLPFWQSLFNRQTATASAALDINETSSSSNQSSSTDSTETWKTPFLVGVFLALFVTAIQITITLISIRRHLLQLFRGDYSEISKRDNSKKILYGTGNLHFAGFFIGYAVWGYILCFFLIFEICIIIKKLAANDGRLFDQVLTRVIPVTLLSIFKVYINLFVTKYVLLRKRGDILAINNYRISIIILCINFFLDAFLGFVASITRFINTILITIVFMARLDYTPFGRQFEYKDAGYCAYVGFIQMEAIHRNPSMLAFASVLLVSQRTKHRNYRSLKACQKWHLALFLIRNPSLLLMRKAALARREKNSMPSKEKWLQELNDLTNTNSEILLQTRMNGEHIRHEPSFSNHSDMLVAKL